MEAGKAEVQKLQAGVASLVSAIQSKATDMQNDLTVHCETASKNLSDAASSHAKSVSKAVSLVRAHTPLNNTQQSSLYVLYGDYCRVLLHRYRALRRACPRTSTAW